MTVNTENMSDIRSFFTRLPSANAAAGSSQPRGRPPSGLGSRGGVAAHVARDSKGRVRKKGAQFHSDDEFVASDDDEQLPPRKRAKVKELRTNWSLPENQSRLAHALQLVQRGMSINAASQQADVPFSVVRTRVNGGLSVESHVVRVKIIQQVFSSEQNC